MDKPAMHSLFHFARAAFGLGACLAVLAGCESPKDIVAGAKPAANSATPANNSPPSISSITNVTVNQDQAFTVNFTITDPDSPLDCSSSMYVTVGDANLLPPNQITRAGMAPNCSFRFQPGAGYWGTTFVKLQVSDGKFTASSSFNVTVNQGTATPIVSSASAAEGNNAVFTVSLNHALPGSKTFTYATSDGTAFAGTNYTATSGTVTFAAGETVKTVTVPTIHDNAYTNTLTFSLVVNMDGNTVLGAGAITDIDGPPTASSTGATASEGSALTFTVNLSHSSPVTTTVTYATSDGTAVAGTNYTATSGTLTFAAGQTSQTVTVPTINDGIVTANLTMTLSLTTNGVTKTATGTITDVQGPVAASAADVTVNEGSAATFTVNLNHASASTVTVTYATANGTASAGANYTSTSGTLTFSPGQIAKTVTVPTIADGVYTPDLTFTLGLSLSGVSSSATGTITNTDAAPTASAAAAAANEGSNVRFTVTLDKKSSSATAVTYSTTNGTAVSGTNYTSSSGILSIPAGSTTATLYVPTLHDSVNAGPLTFMLSLTAGGTTNTATGTVNDIDAAPTPSVSSVSANEGSNLVFTVTLNRASTSTTSVTYATADGTAAAGTNYTAASGTLTFNPGVTTQTVTVATASDSKFSPDLTITLSATANGSTASGTGTIVNTDSVPTASAGNVTAAEGSNLVFTVTLSAASAATTTVTYATSDVTAKAGINYASAAGTLTFAAGQTTKTVTISTTADSTYAASRTFTLGVTAGGQTNYATGTITGVGAPTASAASASANEGSNVVFTVTLDKPSTAATTVAYATSDGTAVAGTNYTSTSGTLSIPAGSTTATLSVPTLHDSVYAANLTFTLSLTAGGATNTATGTVNDADGAPIANVSNVTANEGSNLVFTVSLNHASTTSTTVTYATADGTAVAGTNYTAASGTLTFTAGQTSKTVTVTSASDSKYSADLTFTLSATTNGVTNFGTGTIVNTDAAPTASAANVSAAAGSNLVFTVTLSAASAATTIVTYATSDVTAKAGVDYTSASGTLTFTAGQTSKTVTIASQANSTYAASRTFTLSVTTGGVMNPATGTITDAAAPTASASAASANEGSNVVFTVNLDRVSSTATSVTYSTSDGTAVGGTNYTSSSGTLSIPAGSTSATLSVPTLHDNVYTANLTFTLGLTAGGTTNNATGTVNDIDGVPTASVSNVTANEGSNLVFTITLNHASASSTSVTYATADGTAAAGTNYTAASGTLTYTAGQTSKTVTVASASDSKYSPDLTFTLGATTGGVTNYGTGTITNTDPAPTASAANVSANEGSNLVFTVNLSAAAATTTTVTYATTDVTAKAGTNYTAATGTLTFTAGQTSKTVTIASLADSTYTPSLTFKLGLTAGGTTNNATGTIVNTDTVPTVSVSAAASSVVEGNPATFNFTLNHASSQDVVVNYATANGTATGGSDFGASSGSLTISAGTLSTSVAVPTYDDNVDEQDETFSMSITAATNASLGTVSASVTIQDTVLWFDFTSASLPSGLTFARSSSGTYYDSSGTLQTAASGTPRFDYDPANCTGGTCALKGLLIEEARTNLLLQSSTYNTTWTSSACTLTAAATTSPSGATDAYSLLASGGNTNTNRISQTVTLAASTTYTLSFYVKNNNSTKSTYEVNAANSGTTGKSTDITWAGAVPTVSAGTVQALPNGWYRVATTFTTNASDAGSASVNFYPSPTLHNGAAYAWGAQLEAGSTPSSYLATTTGTVSRSGDSLSVDNFSTWFNATAWTAILDFSRPAYESSSSTATPVLFSACDTTSGATCSTDFFEATYLPSDNTFRGRSTVASSIVATSNYTNAATLTDVKVQMAVAQSSGGALQTVVNGTAATASGAASTPTLHGFLLGGSGLASAPTRQINGHLKKFTYRARSLTTAQMQAMTTD